MLDSFSFRADLPRTRPSSPPTPPPLASPAPVKRSPTAYPTLDFFSEIDISNADWDASDAMDAIQIFTVPARSPGHPLQDAVARVPAPPPSHRKIEESPARDDEAEYFDRGFSQLEDVDDGDVPVKKRKMEHGRKPTPLPSPPRSTPDDPDLDNDKENHPSPNQMSPSSRSRLIRVVPPTPRTPPRKTAARTHPRKPGALSSAAALAALRGPAVSSARRDRQGNREWEDMDVEVEVPSRGPGAGEQRVAKGCIDEMTGKGVEMDEEDGVIVRVAIVRGDVASDTSVLPVSPALPRSDSPVVPTPTAPPSPTSPTITIPDLATEDDSDSDSDHGGAPRGIRRVARSPPRSRAAQRSGGKVLPRIGRTLPPARPAFRGLVAGEAGVEKKGGMGHGGTGMRSFDADMEKESSEARAKTRDADQVGGVLRGFPSAPSPAPRMTPAGVKRKRPPPLPTVAVPRRAERRQESTKDNSCSSTDADGASVPPRSQIPHSPLRTNSPVCWYHLVNSEDDEEEDDLAPPGIRFIPAPPPPIRVWSIARLAQLAGAAVKVRTREATEEARSEPPEAPPHRRVRALPGPERRAMAETESLIKEFADVEKMTMRKDMRGTPREGCAEVAEMWRGKLGWDGSQGGEWRWWDWGRTMETFSMDSMMQTAPSLQRARKNLLTQIAQRIRCATLPPIRRARLEQQRITLRHVIAQGGKRSGNLSTTTSSETGAEGLANESAGKPPAVAMVASSDGLQQPLVVMPKSGPGARTAVTVGRKALAEFRFNPSVRRLKEGKDAVVISKEREGTGGVQAEKAEGPSEELCPWG